jgi:hypothetical protein
LLSFYAACDSANFQQKRKAKAPAFSAYRENGRSKPLPYQENNMFYFFRLPLVSAKVEA